MKSTNEGILDIFRKIKPGVSVFTPDGAGVVDERNGKTVVVDLMRGWHKDGKGRQYGTYNIEDLELMESKQLNEGSYRGDLQRLVKSELHIDQHRSKMGEDDDIIVCSFKVTGKEAAHDLAHFLEVGYGDILDADVSPGEIQAGDFLVFFELSRRTKAVDLIYKIVEETLNLTLQNIDEWEFTYGRAEERGTRTKYIKYPFTKENLHRMVPTSPREYRQSQPELMHDDDDIAAMKMAADMPVNQPAPQDEEMDNLKAQAGII